MDDCCPARDLHWLGVPSIKIAPFSASLRQSGVVLAAIDDRNSRFRRHDRGGKRDFCPTVPYRFWG